MLIKTKRRIAKITLASTLVLGFVQAYPMGQNDSHLIVRAETHGVEKLTVNIHSLQVDNYNLVQNTGREMSLNEWGKNSKGQANAQEMKGYEYTLVDISPRYYYLREKGYDQSKETVGEAKLAPALVEKGYVQKTVMSHEEAMAQIAYEYQLLITIDPATKALTPATVNPTTYFGFGQTLSTVRDGAAQDGDGLNDGNARFADVAKKSPAATAQMPGYDRDAVYVFYRTYPEDQNFPALPTVLALPVYEADDAENDTIHLYPKTPSEKALGLTKTLTKVEHQSTGDPTYNYGTGANIQDNTTWGNPNVELARLAEDEAKTIKTSAGDIFTYEVSFRIPSDIGVNPWYTDDNLYLYDLMPDSFIYQNFSVNGIGIGTQYGSYDETTGVFTNSGLGQARNGDDIQFAFNREALQDLYNAGVKTFAFHVTVKLDPRDAAGKAFADKKLENKVILPTPDGPLIDETTKVETGGYKFIKIDSSTLKTLAGAEFLLEKKDETKIALKSFVDSETGKTIYYPDKSGEKGTYKPGKGSIVTDKDGLIWIVGLEVGDYRLVEVKSPTDYALPKAVDAILNFTVLSPELSKVSPEKSTWVSSDQETDKKKGDGNHDVFNIAKGSLPSTGGMGILLFIVIGLAGSTVAVTAYRKLNQDKHVSEV
ncbi:hypothetical protein RyT2_15880 [Pseudolactococcus yaeyamensis]